MRSNGKIQHELPKKKKKKKKKKNSIDKSNHEKIRDEILLETERFFQLTGDQELNLKLHLERLRAVNRSLEFERWKNLPLSTASSSSILMRDALSSSNLSPRWLSPKESEYDSDSGSATTSTTDEIPYSTAASLFLKGRAQERVLSQAREAISRAANLCQILADPKQPGSIERRDVLIRAFRAITTDVTDMKPFPETLQ